LRTFLISACIIAALVSARRPTDILGWWHGTSTCVKADWNASCRDEEVYYEFTRIPPDSNHVKLDAFKVVQGKVVPMGDLAFVYSPQSRAWDGDFANARVSIRWTYEIRNDTLVGRVIVRPEMRKGRDVLATRSAPPPNR